MKPFRLIVNAASFKQFEAAYSADRIMDEKPVKVATDGEGRLYTGVGVDTFGRTGKLIKVRRLYRVDEWPGKQPQTYPERVASNLRGDRFYGGMLVTHGGAKYVLGRSPVEVVKARG
jgi:hypothetical protein